MAYIGSKASNGAILISTKSGLGTVGKKASNFRIIRPIGYQVKRESYSPSYPVVYGAINNGGNSFRTIYWSPDLLLDKAAALLRPETKLVVCLHASNVCGTVMPAQEIGNFCKEHELLFILPFL